MSTLKVVPDQPADLVDLVAAEVRAHMARRRITQVQLAEILGIKQVSVSERLRGKTPFRLEEIQIIADAFGIHPAALLGGNSPSPSGGSTLRSHHGFDTLRDVLATDYQVRSQHSGAMRGPRELAAA